MELFPRRIMFISQNQKYYIERELKYDIVLSLTYSLMSPQSSIHWSQFPKLLLRALRDTQGEISIKSPFFKYTTKPLTQTLILA